MVDNSLFVDRWLYCFGRKDVPFFSRSTTKQTVLQDLAHLDVLLDSPRWRWDSCAQGALRRGLGGKRLKNWEKGILRALGNHPQETNVIESKGQD